jgi:outer membrane receptor protein involved in Fe transport
VFHNTITDLIGNIAGGFVQPPGFPFPIPTTATAANNGSAISDGFEIDSRFALSARTNVRANYAYLNAQQNHQEAEFSPRNHVNVTLDSAFTKRFTGYAAMHYVDSSYERSFTPGTVKLGSYIDVDAKLGYKLSGSVNPWEFAIAATNVFNVPHYEMPNVMLGSAPTAAAIPRRAWLELSGGW